MAVYVDNFNIQATVPNGSRSCTGVWCHMTADTREELDAMADRIGLRQSWIQKPGTWSEHYDVTASRRAAAVAAGAIEVDARERVMAMAERRRELRAKAAVVAKPKLTESEEVRAFVDAFHLAQDEMVPRMHRS